MSFDGKEVLITGGAGFVGSHLAEKLTQLGSKVTILDDFSSGRIENIPFIPKTNILKCDVSNLDELRPIIVRNGYDLIFHYAANASVPKSVDDRENDFRRNVVGTFNVLHSAIDSKCARVVFASSSAVYGQKKDVVHELDLADPMAPYGLGKLVGEQYGRMYSDMFDLPVLCMRYFNIYGPRQPRYVMFDFIQKFLRDEKKIAMLGTPDITRDFIYCSDAVDATLDIVQKSTNKFDIYNVGTGKGTQIGDLCRLMNKLLVEMTGSDDHREIVYSGSSWKGDIKQIVADSTKLDSIGFRPKYTLEEGLRFLIKSYLNNGEPLKQLVELVTSG